MRSFTKAQRGDLSKEKCDSIVADIVNRGEECMQRFQYALECGSQVQYAAMFATKQGPGIHGTEQSFSRGHTNQQWANEMPPWMAEHAFSEAKKAGISTTGKIWKRGLGKANDPMAWVSDTHDVRKAAESKNLAVEGAVTVNQPEREPPKPVKLAPEIVNEIATKRCAEDPGLAHKVRNSPKEREKLRSEIVEKHGNPKVKE